MSRLPFVDRSALMHARIARATVAVAFVAGITALIVLPLAPETTLAPGTFNAPSVDYLHAPAADPSLPAAEAVFASRHDDVAPQAPTF